ncbi:hypothetical protein A2160_05100 [Candidatus Beckwithbacteria bacterium RBG_13_42_9]|uniref:Uncharacterized protein n=1 Tax=Candidatus Beckwithbacteria bacterium RBG_13_42_9 TaxID=1797457 RepID=A0A1F5E6K1_9BACT|nr:MAG: hypothetical protein A2160_05100 [Candidatus Beckwithbacteria bacterium RBG_13_42_9]
MTELYYERVGTEHDIEVLVGGLGGVEAALKEIIEGGEMIIVEQTGRKEDVGKTIVDPGAQARVFTVVV